jgi:hypothetical protein
MYRAMVGLFQDCPVQSSNATCTEPEYAYFKTTLPNFQMPHVQSHGRPISRLPCAIFKCYMYRAMVGLFQDCPAQSSNATCTEPEYAYFKTTLPNFQMPHVQSHGRPISRLPCAIFKCYMYRAMVGLFQDWPAQSSNATCTEP